jgi:hypothetical protein
MPKLASISAAVRKRNHLGLLLNGQGGQEDGHEAVLTKRHTEVRMAGDLKEEAAIAPLV